MRASHRQPQHHQQVQTRVRVVSPSLALLVLCVATLVVALDATRALAVTFRFNTICSAAPWSARTLPSSLFVYPRDLTYVMSPSNTTVTVPANTALVLLGGQAVQGPENDIWLSTDSGVSWNLVAGISRYGAAGNRPAPTPYSQTSFDPFTYPCVTSSLSTGQTYVIGGQSSSAATWVSSNLFQWHNPTNSSANSSVVYTPSREQAFCASAGSTALLMNGFQNNNFVSDLWRTTNEGNAWTRVTPNTQNGYRSTAVALESSSSLTPNVTSIISFSHQQSVPDVWVSSDFGALWITLTQTAPFAHARPSIAVAAPNRILVSIAPYQNIIDTSSVWASLDGGWTWGNCLSEANVLVRQEMVAGFDAQGYLVLAAGQDANGYRKDVLRSTISFLDVNATSAACGVSIPQCGPGLSCWPSSSGRQWTSYGVTCDACPLGPVPPPPTPDASSSGGASGGGASGGGASTGASSPSSSSDKDVIIKAAVGAGAGAVVVLALFVYCCWWRRRRQNQGGSRLVDSSPLATSLSFSEQGGRRGLTSVAPARMNVGQYDYLA